MKNILIVVLIFSQNFAFTQEASVEKSTTGVQIGVIGGWVHNEYKLTNQIVLKSEIGTDLINLGKNSTTMYAPTLNIEPRWYYNLNKRMRNGKNITKNSGSFLSFHLKARYNTQFDSYEMIAIPMIGLRRTYWDHFNFELGLGYVLGFKLSDVPIFPHMRIGYTF